jgi:hypothetical protein
MKVSGDLIWSLKKKAPSSNRHCWLAPIAVWFPPTATCWPPAAPQLASHGQLWAVLLLLPLLLKPDFQIGYTQ